MSRYCLILECIAFFYSVVVVKFHARKIPWGKITKRKFRTLLSPRRVCIVASGIRGPRVCQLFVLLCATLVKQSRLLLLASAGRLNGAMSWFSHGDVVGVHPR